jgi:hypothetical protein
MGKSFELNSARLMAGAAAIAVPMAMASTPADAGASGGGQTVFVSDESCTICTGDINSNTPSSAIVSMISGDPTNPFDQQNPASILLFAAHIKCLRFWFRARAVF